MFGIGMGCNAYIRGCFEQNDTQEIKKEQKRLIFTMVS